MCVEQYLRREQCILSDRGDKLGGSAQCACDSPERAPQLLNLLVLSGCHGDMTPEVLRERVCLFMVLELNMSDTEGSRSSTPQDQGAAGAAVKGQREELSEAVVLRGIFRLGKKSHDVLLTRTCVSWTSITPEHPTAGEASVGPSGRLLLRDVFAVKVKRRRCVGQSSGGAVLGLALFWARHHGPRLKEETLQLLNASSEHTQLWYNTIKDLLRDLGGRPSFLKVLINPSSHRKEAVHVYREHVAPLFKMAAVQTDITVTEKEGHTLSLMKECKLDQYDGVVVVGGDGSVAELCHGLVLRTQLDTGSALENPRTVSLPLGIIPAGSTDIVSCSVHGVRDPVTAALHIILGHVLLVDMCSFWSLGQLVRYGFSSMFGFGGRSLACAEKRRWMPSSQRRDYAVVKTLARLRAEDCEVSYVEARTSSPEPLSDKTQDCDQDSHHTGSEEEAESWTTNQGLYLNISVMSIPGLSPHTPRGLAPNTRLANGSAALISVSNTSRTQFIKHLKRLGAPTGQLDFPFVESHAVTAVKIQPRAVIGSEEESEEEPIQSESSTFTTAQSQKSTFPWNIDGELVHLRHEVLIRVHPRLISLFGQQVEQAESSVSCGCI
ncbi:ceramide kinase-like protein [Periophthalmus magnuspinnatus]|uniref:ceramide kinase-like protein n=1 Tax=Periophthalmus magnuspinnatus TaxID=409849 RepID=UPI002436DD1F|nr:ceramide kinase-like protein [Periophthalmus magnuspinnatus]